MNKTDIRLMNEKYDRMIADFNELERQLNAATDPEQINKLSIACRAAVIELDRMEYLTETAECEEE